MLISGSPVLQYRMGKACLYGIPRSRDMDSLIFPRDTTMDQDNAGSHRLSRVVFLLVRTAHSQGTPWGEWQEVTGNI